MKKIALLFVAWIMLFSGCSYEQNQHQTKKESTSTQKTVSTVEEKPVEPVVHQATLAVVGDIMVHDYQYNEAYDPETQQYDFMHNFQEVKPYLQGNDFVIGNLETTFGGSEFPISSYPTFNTPDSFLEALQDAGFNLVTTANNHCMDTSQAGLVRTLDKLDQYGIDHVGTYRSQEEQNQIYIKEQNGIRFAFLSYTYGTNGIPVPEPYLVNHLNKEQIQQDLNQARSQADIVVVLPHMGIEYEEEPSQAYQDWMTFFLEQGADIVLASHPHVLQPMEYRTIVQPDGTKKTGFILYSLGNFISSQTTPPRNASIILHMTIEKVGEEIPHIAEVSFLPIWTQFRNAANENHFMVRSVYDMLSLPEETRNQVVRLKDYQRLLEIQQETTKTLLGNEVPLENMQKEYVFPAHDCP